MGYHILSEERRTSCCSLREGSKMRVSPPLAGKNNLLVTYIKVLRFWKVMIEFQLLLSIWGSVRALARGAKSEVIVEILSTAFITSFLEVLKFGHFSS